MRKLLTRGLLTLVLTLFTATVVQAQEPCYSRDTVREAYEICANQSGLIWRHGIILDHDSTYRTFDTFAVVGYYCDSIVVHEAKMTILALPEVHIEGDDTICQDATTTFVATTNGTLRWRGPLVNGAATNSVSVGIPGMYIAQATNELQCMSSDTIILVVNPKPIVDTFVTICADTYAIFENDTLTDSGSYTKILTTRAGCDSTRQFHLTVNPLPELAETGVIPFCEGTTMCITAQGGYRYHWSTGSDSNVLCITHGDTYTVTAWTEMGCHVTDTLIVEAYPTYDEHQYAQICDGGVHNFYNRDYTRPGDYEHLEYTTHHCDSLVTLHLSMKAYATSEFVIHVADSHEWNGLWYKQSGSFSQRFPGSNGCDSIAIMHLQIVKGRPVPRIMMLDERLLMVNHTQEYPDTLLWHGYHAYQWYRNGRQLRHATSDIYHNDGYTVLSGCYYVMVAVDENEQEWMSSDTICVNYIGIDETATPKATISPNPARRGTTLHVDGVSVHQLILSDLRGRKITESASNILRIPSQMAAGIYALTIVLDDGQSLSRQIVIE